LRADVKKFAPIFGFGKRNTFKGNAGRPERWNASPHLQILEVSYAASNRV
jgi:hypothetical protein